MKNAGGTMDSANGQSSLFAILIPAMESGFRKSRTDGA